MDPRDAIVTEGRLSYFAAKDTVLCLVTPLGEFKICRIRFGRDGSIYVSFPYCREKHGILNTVDRVAGVSQAINLSVGGKRVRADVKFSHHTSGIAQFSKTSSWLRSGPRNQSFRLDGPIGHLFDLHLFWPAGFDLLKKKRKKDLYLALGLSENRPAFLFTAQWRRKSDILANTRPPDGTVPPTTEVQHRESGHKGVVYFLGQPGGYPLDDHLLMISGGPIDLPDGTDRTGMVFMGGWDHHAEGEAVSGATRGLVFMYPSGGVPEAESDGG